MEALLKKNQEAQSLISVLTSQIEILKKHGVNTATCESEGLAIKDENKVLAAKIAAMKTELIKTELINGGRIDGNSLMTIEMFIRNAN